MRNPCKECDYYHEENNTCQSKKCCTSGSGYITWIDRLFCKPYKHNADRKTEPKRGEWVDMGDFERCSVCKGTHLKEFQSYYGKTTWIKTPYCPYCGAKMADRKTENSSEKPNNCEDEPQTYITEDRDTQILDAWQVHHRNTTSVETEPQTERSE